MNAKQREGLIEYIEQIAPSLIREKPGESYYPIDVSRFKFKESDDGTQLEIPGQGMASVTKDDDDPTFRKFACILSVNRRQVEVTHERNGQHIIPRKIKYEGSKEEAGNSSEYRGPIPSRIAPNIERIANETERI